MALAAASSVLVRLITLGGFPEKSMPIRIHLKGSFSDAKVSLIFALSSSLTSHISVGERNTTRRSKKARIKLAKPFKRSTEPEVTQRSTYPGTSFAQESHL